MWKKLPCISNSRPRDILEAFTINGETFPDEKLSDILHNLFIISVWHSLRNHADSEISTLNNNDVSQNRFLLHKRNDKL